MFIDGIEKKEEEVAKMAGKIDLDTLLPPDTDDKTIMRHMMALIGDIPERMARIEAWMAEQQKLKGK